MYPTIKFGNSRSLQTYAGEHSYNAFKAHIDANMGKAGSLPKLPSNPSGANAAHKPGSNVLRITWRNKGTELAKIYKGISFLAEVWPNKQTSITSRTGDVLQVVQGNGIHSEHIMSNSQSEITIEAKSGSATSSTNPGGDTRTLPTKKPGSYTLRVTWRNKGTEVANIYKGASLLVEVKPKGQKVMTSQSGDVVHVVQGNAIHSEHILDGSQEEITIEGAGGIKTSSANPPGAGDIKKSSPYGYKVRVTWKNKGREPAKLFQKDFSNAGRRLIAELQRNEEKPIVSQAGDVLQVVLGSELHSEHIMDGTKATITIGGEEL